MDALLYLVGIALFGFRIYCFIYGPHLPRGRRKPPSGGLRVQSAKPVVMKRQFAGAAFA